MAFGFGDILMLIGGLGLPVRHENDGRRPGAGGGSRLKKLLAVLTSNRLLDGSGRDRGHGGNPKLIGHNGDDHRLCKRRTDEPGASGGRHYGCEHRHHRHFPAHRFQNRPILP